MSGIRSDIISRLAAVSRDLTVHSPTDEQKRAKACFWSFYQASGTPAPDQIDLALAQKHCGDKRILSWWPLPGFQDWFLNSGEFVQRVEFLSNMALDSLEDILRDRGANATAKINAVKLIMEIGQKIPSKNQDPGYADEKIGKMNKEELQDFIEKNLRKLPAIKRNTEDLTSQASSEKTDTGSNIPPNI